jgi:hypothetical protein
MGRCRKVDSGGWLEYALTMRLLGHTDEEIAAASGLVAATTRQRLHRFFRNTRSWLASGTPPGNPEYTTTISSMNEVMTPRSGSDDPSGSIGK